MGHIARLLELEEQLKRRPRQLSGGQRQRVAMGRAIIREPRAFLMDEPLSNLDAKLRTHMRAEISLLHKELGITMIFVTHDQVEAMTLGQRVAVMRKGELQQVASPQVLYDSPVNVFVAGFIGSPSINFFEGQLERDDGRFIVAVGQHRLALDAIEVARAERLADHVGAPRTGVRRSTSRMPPSPPHAADRAPTGHVRLRESFESEVVVHFQVEAAPVVSDDLRELAADVDESALLDVHDQERRLRRTAFVGRFGVGTKVSEDAAAQIAIAPGAIRFFDPESGIAL